MPRYPSRFVVPALVLLFAATRAVAPAAAVAPLDPLIAEFEQLMRRADPITAGLEGDIEALRRLPDVSRASELALRSDLTRLGERLAAIPSATLPAGDALNHALLTLAVTRWRQEIDFDFNRIAFTNDSGFQTTLDELGRQTPVSDRETAEAWLARLAAATRYYTQNIENLRRGLATKVIQPRIVVERAVTLARNQVEMPELGHPVLLPFEHSANSLPPEVRTEYRSRAQRLLQEQIRPAQREALEFLEREYLPAAGATLARRSVPDGEAMYRFLVQRETTTRLAPEEVHELGRREVARIRGLMEGIVKEVRFAGTFAEFLRDLRTHARFYPRTGQELLEKASEIAKRADDGLPALFGTLPRLTYGVRPVPAAIADGYTTGRYWPGSLVLGQAGAYMVNTSRLEQRPLYELPALTLHEAVPGHHLQIALAQELGAMPYFRRNLNFTAFTEGWGLYAEFLGEEMGIYRDPYERFGRYSMEMWRACRLVADTGIHWLGWDLEEARRWFSENSALAPHNIQTELERYVSDPGQALAYKVGELKLRELRQRARQQLGERFNVRRFHDALLLSGPLPLEILEQQVERWIAQTQAARP